ncbi:hypothetical protein [Thioalkalivibrio sp. ALMg3]|uniref:hypothetical protein n=1 Tax=Thioalkalivibrio sp. ALMg3 TaxID=1158163 RepID=UPI0012DFA1DC|nr:hypothetical protein [Thioalkalivibrio sp. ALMg3]
MNREEFAKSIEVHLPGYLSSSSYDELIRQLRKAPDIDAFFWNPTDQEAGGVLQGDAWTHIPIRDTSTGEQKHVTGVVLSNSCDIDPTNEGRPNRRVLVAPAIKLSNYEQLLHNARPDRSRNLSHVEDVRRNRVSSITHFPAESNINETERVVILDHVYSVPLEEFQSAIETRVFRLSNAGFYIFLLKLSIHFTRLHERVDRSGN